MTNEEIKKIIEQARIIQAEANKIQAEANRIMLKKIHEANKQLEEKKEKGKSKKIQSTHNPKDLERARLLKHFEERLDQIKKDQELRKQLYPLSEFENRCKICERYKYCHLVKVFTTKERLNCCGILLRHSHYSPTIQNLSIPECQEEWITRLSEFIIIHTECDSKCSNIDLSEYQIFSLATGKTGVNLINNN